MNNINTTDAETYIGKILFFPRGHTFFKVTGVTHYSEEEMNGAIFLDVVELNNREKTSQYGLQEIDEELFIVNPDFSEKDISHYQTLARKSEEINQEMYDVAMKIVNYQQYKDLK